MNELLNNENFKKALEIIKRDQQYRYKNKFYTDKIDDDE